MSMKEIKLKEIEFKEYAPSDDLRSMLKLMKRNCIIYGSLSVLGFVACVLDWSMMESLPGWRYVVLTVCGLALAVVSCVMIWKLMRNVRRHEIFTRTNVSLIKNVGDMVQLYGLLLMLLGREYGGSRIFMCTVIVLAGTFIQFVSYLVDAGITMREDQELTI